MTVHPAQAPSLFQAPAGPGGRARTDRLGGDFGLGQPTGAWAATRRPPRFLAGSLILAGLACGGVIPAFGETGFAQIIAAMIVGDLAALGVALMMFPTSGVRERLYRYEAGLVMVADGVPEPVVLRWADLVAVSTRVISGYDDDYVSSCDGHRVTVATGTRSPRCIHIARRAERVRCPLPDRAHRRCHRPGGTGDVRRALLGR